MSDLQREILHGLICDPSDAIAGVGRRALSVQSLSAKSPQRLRFAAMRGDLDDREPHLDGGSDRGVEDVQRAAVIGHDPQ